MSKTYVLFLAIVIFLSLSFAYLCGYCLFEKYTFATVYSESGVIKTNFNGAFAFLGLVLGIASFGISIKALIVDKEKNDNETELNRVIMHLREELEKEKDKN